MVSPPTTIVPPLLAWYRQVARDLPWRRDPSGYHTLLSELMCQQTRVETVIPYFERFVARWPAVEDLAAANLEDVLHAWSGLGYYRRARALHAAAIAAVAAGGMPKTAAGLRDLPGVGAYTAGAIASIAYGEPAPAVDGNVERVLSRLDRAPEEPWSASGKRAITERASALLEVVGTGPDAGALNQALMELGATVCTPRRPLCPRCPVRDACAAYAAAEVDRWPRVRAKKAPTEMRATFALVHTPRGFLLGQRAPDGLLGGLWEPLRAPADDEIELGAAFSARCGLGVTVHESLGEVVHIFTHRRLVADVRRATVDPGELIPGEEYDDVRFVVDPETLPLSKLARRVLDLALSPSLFAIAAEPPLSQ
jgi:A/G-specific adenine glycosylase